MSHLEDYLQERVRLHEFMANESVEDVIQWYNDCATLYEKVSNNKHISMKIGSDMQATARELSVVDCLERE